MKNLLIYGATGYNGRMIVQHVVALGVPVIIAGRNEGKLADDPPPSISMNTLIRRQT